MDKRKKYLILVRKQIIMTKDYLNTLNDQISYNTDLLNWFQRLCTYLTKLIVFLTDFYKNTEKNVECKETLLLYLHQLLTILSLLINIFVRESEVDQPINEIRFFCKKQMVWSLDGIEETLSSNSYLEVPKGNFINWMDLALDKIKEIDYVNKKDQSIDIFNEANLYFEEVLSHAMSIAQVTLEDDYKKIRGSSQSVLEVLGSLSTELNKKKPNIAMLNLFMDACTNKLCALECKVNTAVLKLSLKVFSEYILPLEAIHNFCFDKTNKGKQDELDNLVVDFDLHVDRILQIGLFAISCSSSTNNCVKIRSSLASLEALETELVPAFTSVLLDFNLKNCQLALLLKDHWINQALVLQKLIYLIIDPFAFCEVIFEENKQSVEELSDILKLKSTIDAKCFEQLVRQSKVLEDFITVVLEEEQEHNVEEIKKVLLEFSSVLHEAKSAQDLLPKGKSNCLRILKRCKILCTSTKAVWSCFLNENCENDNSFIKENGDGDKVGNNQSKSNFGNDFLDHIVSRGQQILKDRSILYRTSIRNETFKVPNSLGTRSKNGIASQLSSLKLTHIRNRTFINSINRNTTELHMSDILKELNNLTHISLSKK